MRSMILALTMTACTTGTGSGDTDGDTDAAPLVEQTAQGSCEVGEHVAWEVPAGTVAVTVYACVEDNGEAGATPTEQCWDRKLNLNDVGEDGYLRFTCVNDNSMNGPFWRIVYVAPLL